MEHSLIKLSTILFFILILISCNKENSNTTMLYKTGHFEIAIDDSVDNTKYLWLDYFDKKTNTNYLYDYNIIRNSIDIYNCNSKKLFKSIYFVDYHIESGGGIFILNFDSIYVFDRKMNEIFLCDTSSVLKKKNKWSIASIVKSYKPDYEVSSGLSPMILNNNSVYMRAGSNATPLKFYKGKCLFIYNLQSRKGIIKVPFPEIYHHNKDFGKYGSSFCLFNNQLIYSFEIDPNLYIYDLQGNLLKSINAKSNFLNKIEFIDSTKLTDIDFFRKFNLTHGSYYKLIYDKYNQLFYRIIRHNMPLLDSNNFVYNLFEADWSIIILDENFNILTEQVFKGKEYDFSSILPTPMGLLIYKNPKLDREHIAFDIYKFKKD